MQVQPPRDLLELTLTSVGAGSLDSAVSWPEAERSSCALGRGCAGVGQASSQAQSAALHAAVIQESWERNSVKNLSKVLKNPSVE